MLKGERMTFADGKGNKMPLMELFELIHEEADGAYWDVRRLNGFVGHCGQEKCIKSSRFADNPEDKYMECPNAKHCDRKRRIDHLLEYINDKPKRASVGEGS